MSQEKGFCPNLLQCSTARPAPALVMFAHEAMGSNLEAGVCHGLALVWCLRKKLGPENLFSLFPSLLVPLY